MSRVLPALVAFPASTMIPTSGKQVPVDNNNYKMKCWWGFFVVDFMVANFDKSLHMHRIIIIDNFV